MKTEGRVNFNLLDNLIDEGQRDKFLLDSSFLQ